MSKIEELALLKELLVKFENIMIDGYNSHFRAGMKCGIRECQKIVIDAIEEKETEDVEVCDDNN